MSNRDISNFLNSMGIKTPKGKDYYPNLIWVTLQKYRKRLERYSPYKVVRSSEKLMIEKISVYTEDVNIFHERLNQ
jgi:hypothetical protein